jgi:hypothetical protein
LLTGTSGRFYQDRKVELPTETKKYRKKNIMETKVLNQFKQIREQLVTEFNTKKAEVVAMETELIALGIIPSTQPTAPKELLLGNADIKSGSREEKILKALSKGAKTEKAIKEITKLSGINVLLNNMVKGGKLNKSDDRPAQFGIKTA